MKTPRTGGRRGRVSRRTGTIEKRFDKAWRRWVNPYTPVKQFSDDEIEAIHNAALRILRDIGVKVLCDEARALYTRAGMTAVDEIVRFDPEATIELIRLAPAEVTLHGRGDDREVVVGGANVGVCTTGGTPNFSDIKNGRAPGTLKSLDNFCRVSQSFDVIHMIGPFVEPQDIPTNIRHLEMMKSVVTLTEKVPFVYFRGTEAVADCHEMLRIAHGLGPEEFVNKPVCYSVANSNSPLMLDLLMCRGIIDSAQAGQLMILTPFTLSGAMAPVTLPGALAQQHAEAIAGIALSQIVRPGAPVCYGSFTSNVDMKSGAPAFGTPEYVKAAFASGQLARHLNLPMRSSGVTGSNAPDAQAAYEMEMSLWGALMGGANILLHGAGWLEGGLTASAEKFIMDIEMLQMFAELFKPVEVNEETLGIAAIADVGHGGHFFGTRHTLERFETAFYSPLLSDWSNFENYTERGSVDATMRAYSIFYDTANAHEPPPMDQDRLEELEDFVSRRTREGGANIER